MKPHTNRELFNILADEWKMDDPIRVHVKTVTSPHPITCLGRVKVINGQPTIVIDLDHHQPRLCPAHAAGYQPLIGNTHCPECHAMDWTDNQSTPGDSE